VQAGAELLDKELGPGWEDLIDLDTLALESSCQCIVGQLRQAKPVRRTMFKKGIGNGFPAEYGFDTRGRTSYRTLTRHWKWLIAARRIAKIKAAAGIKEAV
jgi:hypothetical protein